MRKNNFQVMIVFLVSVIVCIIFFVFTVSKCELDRQTLEDKTKTILSLEQNEKGCG